MSFRCGKQFHDMLGEVLFFLIQIGGVDFFYPPKKLGARNDGNSLGQNAHTVDGRNPAPPGM